MADDVTGTKPADVRWERVCVVGVGLIGGSLARALKTGGLCREVIGAGRSEASLEAARTLGVIDRYNLDPARAAAGADLVVLAVPPGAVAAVTAALAPALAPETILTDVGSVKAPVIEAVREGLGRLPATFVPGHPIAGSERGGAAASDPNLFRGRRVILTPTDVSAPDALARVRALWELVGARVLEMDPAEHDRVLAATSHLPHVLAYALLAGLERRLGDDLVCAAGGLWDTTRIASSAPSLWRDISLANRHALAEEVAAFRTDLEQVERWLRENNGDALEALFRRAKRVRDAALATEPHPMD